jgi:hypothetical protein
MYSLPTGIYYYFPDASWTRIAGLCLVLRLDHDGGADRGHVKVCAPVLMDLHIIWISLCQVALRLARLLTADGCQVDRAIRNAGQNKGTGTSSVVLFLEEIQWIISFCTSRSRSQIWWCTQPVRAEKSAWTRIIESLAI